MTTQHTPTPCSLGFKDSQNIYSDNKQIACVYCGDKNWSENARFIVRACNSHDELVKAVEDALLIANLHDFEGAAIDNFKRVLKLAKGDI